MSKLFRFVQDDDVLKSFEEFKNSVLLERPVVIARNGDYTLFLRRVSDDELELTTENTKKSQVTASRTYVVSDTTKELVARGTRHACQKMSELSDEDVNRKRLQIWKWYIMDWQLEYKSNTKELVEKELHWQEDVNDNRQEILDRLKTFPYDRNEYWVITGSAMVIYGILSEGENRHDLCYCKAGLRCG